MIPDLTGSSLRPGCLQEQARQDGRMTPTHRAPTSQDVLMSYRPCLQVREGLMWDKRATTPPQVASNLVVSLSPRVNLTGLV